MAEKKRTPRNIPPADQRAAADTPRIRMRIDGGNREEKYDFRFEISQAGICRCGLSSLLSGRDIPDQTAPMELEEADRVVRSLSAGLRRAAARQSRSKMKPIPPCSLIGILDLFEGPTAIQVKFMADPGQAEQAGNPIPAEVRRAVETIYGLAAKQFGFESAAEIRP